MSFLSTLRKYSIVIAFPAFTVSTIWADYSHTQQWKRDILEQHQKREQLSA